MTVTDGRQIKAARVVLGLTIRQMADLSGVNRNSVLRVEATKTLPRSAWAADRIIKALEDRGINFTVQHNKVGLSFEAAPQRARAPYKRKHNFR